MIMKKNNNTELVKEIKVAGHTLAIYRELAPKENEYRMFGEVVDLGGCFIAGDTEKEILAEAPAVIAIYEEAQKEIAKQKPKLVSVKMKPDLYALVSRYAQDQGIESVSTLMRSVLVKKMREDGYNVSSRLVTSH
jgi:predicted RNase H-like HicB family nuclease